MCQVLQFTCFSQQRGPKRGLSLSFFAIPETDLSARFVDIAEIHPMLKILNYIDGQFSEPGGGSWIPNIDPSRGEQYGLIPDSGEEDIDAAVNAAARSFLAWSGLRGEDRFKWLMKLATAIENELDDFAAAESRDNGKPISLALAVDIPRAIRNFEFFASAAVHFASESHFTEGLGINYTLRRPLGVVGCISPWNLPLYLFTWKIAPALATGNTVVAKPSEVTPMTAFLLSKAADKIGFPKGVLNIVHGSGPKTG